MLIRDDLVAGGEVKPASPWMGVACWPTGVQGVPLVGMQGGLRSFFGPLPAEAWLVERYLKEHVSKRGQRAGCPSPNPRGIAKPAV